MKTFTKKFDYKWIILITCYLMEFICLGFCSSNPGMYTGAVTEALDIKRSLYSIGTSIRYIVQVITALSFGSLIHRFGVKKMVLLGLTALVGSVFLRGVATNIFHIYISSALWGLGIVFSGGTMASTIVRRWFHKDIGKYTGIVMSANGIGGAIAAQIISPIINNGEVFGYQKAYLLSGFVALAISILVLIFLREQPAEGPVINATAKKKAQGAAWVGMEFTEAKRKLYFYLIFAMIFLTGISLQSIGTISIVYMEDTGLNAGFIATTATVSSLFLTFSKILTGFSYDKKGLRFTLLLCHSCAILGFLLKANITNSTIGMVFAMTATILTTVAMPLETVMIPLISNDLFGKASYDKVLGIFMSANSLGLCLGSPLCDIYRDLTGGSYASCFWFFTGLMLVVAICFQLIIRTAYKDKEKIIECYGTEQM